MSPLALLLYWWLRAHESFKLIKTLTTYIFMYLLISVLRKTNLMDLKSVQFKNKCIFNITCALITIGIILLTRTSVEFRFLTTFSLQILYFAKRVFLHSSCRLCSYKLRAPPNRLLTYVYHRCINHYCTRRSELCKYLQTERWFFILFIACVYLLLCSPIIRANSSTHIYIRV